MFFRPESGTWLDRIFNPFGHLGPAQRRASIRRNCRHGLVGTRRIVLVLRPRKRWVLGQIRLDLGDPAAGSQRQNECRVSTGIVAVGVGSESVKCNFGAIHRFAVHVVFGFSKYVHILQNIFVCDRQFLRQSGDARVLVFADAAGGSCSLADLNNPMLNFVDAGLILCQPRCQLGGGNEAVATSRVIACRLPVG